MTLQRLLLAVVLLAATGGCRGQASKDPPIVPIRNMHQQPRYNPQGPSAFFADGRAMRPLVRGTVAREMEVDPRMLTGRVQDTGGWVLEIPVAVVERKGGSEALVQRGRDRYGIYCAPCHGLTGDGQGMVAIRAAALGAGAFQPPSFHADRLRHVPDGQIFATITHGIRNMPPYGPAIPLDDRWAIVSYVRALQISQYTEAPPDAGIPVTDAGVPVTDAGVPAPDGAVAPGDAGVPTPEVQP